MSRGMRRVQNRQSVLPSGALSLSDDRNTVIRHPGTQAPTVYERLFLSYIGDSTFGLGWNQGDMSFFFKDELEYM